MEPTLIATNIADRYGMTLVRTEYRVREPGLQEQAELAAHLRETAFLLERRTSKKHVGEDGTWEAFDWQLLGSGRTAEDAAYCCWESSFVTATSNHALYDQAKRRRLVELRREAWIQRLRTLAQDPDALAVKQQGREAFHAELKRARLYKAASQGKAPQAKVDAIRDRLLAEWQPRIDAAVRVSGLAARKLAAIGEKIYAD